MEKQSNFSEINFLNVRVTKSQYAALCKRIIQARYNLNDEKHLISESNAPFDSEDNLNAYLDYLESPAD